MYLSRGRLGSQLSLGGVGITLAIVFKLGEFFYVQRCGSPLHGTRLLTRLPNLRLASLPSSSNTVRWRRASVEISNSVADVRRVRRIGFGDTVSAMTGTQICDTGNSCFQVIRAND